MSAAAPEPVGVLQRLPKPLRLVFFSKPRSLKDACCLHSNPPNFVAGTSNGSARQPSPLRTEEYTEHLYQTERPVRYKPGTCIIYRLDAWHRGTPAALGKVRYSHHHVWRRADAEWVNWQSLAPRMSAMPNRYLERLTVPQRACALPPSLLSSLLLVAERRARVLLCAYRLGLPTAW